MDDVTCHGSGTPREGGSLECSFAGPLGLRTLRSVTVAHDPRTPRTTSAPSYAVFGDDGATERMRVTRATPEGFQTGGNGYYVARGDDLVGALDLSTLGVPRAHADAELDVYTQHELASVMAVVFAVEGLSFE